MARRHKGGHPRIDERSERTNVFIGEYDDEGVYVYQAYCSEIADYAVLHQQLGGPAFNPTRMTWIKPSFAWMLYRAGYALKHKQEHILKLKLPHDALAGLLSSCSCKHGGGGSKGRVQWDPARDLMSSEGKGKGIEPRKCLRDRAIQIGLSRDLSERYVQSIISIADVTALAQQVGVAHHAKDVTVAMRELQHLLPTERPYVPHCDDETLVRLQMAPAGIAVAARSSPDSDAEELTEGDPAEEEEGDMHTEDNT
mmetsp:Transcript_71302/g.133369  ORF Transcript_71302/g.133369 Transcript_71302/m.133369 type:complete len:254 (+) Transcript_71302:59-820(+)